MNVLDRYLLINFLKIFAFITLTATALIVIYSITDFFLAFKVRDPSLILRYIAHLIPLGFYILSPLIVGISVIVLFRRVFASRLDLTSQSFTITPLRLSLFILLFSGALSGSFLLLNEAVIPSLFKGVWYMEKKFKKREPEKGRIVERLWFVKKTERSTYYIYVDNLEVGSGLFTGLYLLRTGPGNEVIEVVEGRSGRWRDHVIYVHRGSAYNFVEGFFVKELNRFSLGTEVSMDEIGLFAEKIEHVRSSSLITLYTKGSRLGFDANRYFSELMFRAGMSFFPFMLTVPTLWGLLKYRRTGVGALILLGGLVIGWLVIISPKVIADKAGQPPQYALIGYVVIGILILKGIYDLGKGFRV